jgi:hypothetical protein
MLTLAATTLLLATPVLSEADLKVAERLAWRAGVPKGTPESLSTDVTGDGVPDVVLLTRTADRLVLFVAEGPVSPVGRWWRVDLHRGTEAGELCVPASAVLVQVEDHGVVSHALECDKERTGACPTPLGRSLRVEAAAPGGRSRGGAGTAGEPVPAARCPAVHVFFDGSDLRFWSGVGTGRRSPSAGIPAGPFAP